MSYSVKIEEIVIDFTKDEIGNIFFLNVKSFRLLHADTFNRISMMSNDQRALRELEIKGTQIV